MRELRLWLTARYDASGAVRLLAIMAAVAVNLAVFFAWAPSVVPGTPTEQFLVGLVTFLQCLVISLAFTWLFCARD